MKLSIVLVLLVLLVGLSGCYAIPQAYIINDVDGSVVVVEAPQWAVEKTCRSISRDRGQEKYLNDDGKPAREHGVACCADQSERIIYASSEHRSWCIEHELCHLRNSDPRKCIEVKP